MKDSNVWIRAAMRSDGYEYYEMVLVYVHDIMIVNHLGHEVAKQIIDFYKDQGVELRSVYEVTRGRHE